MESPQCQAQQSGSFIGNVIRPKLLCSKRLDGMGWDGIYFLDWLK
mgnify:CR=1 FL=1